MTHAACLTRNLLPRYWLGRRQPNTGRTNRENLRSTHYTSFHDKFCQVEKHSAARARRSAKNENFDSLSLRSMPLGKVPAICRTIHPFAACRNG